jgi:hypothetical protein
MPNFSYTRPLGAIRKKKNKQTICSEKKPVEKQQTTYSSANK